VLKIKDNKGCHRRVLTTTRSRAGSPHCRWSGLWCPCARVFHVGPRTCSPCYVPEGNSLGGGRFKLGGGGGAGEEEEDKLGEEEEEEGEEEDEKDVEDEEDEDDEEEGLFKANAVE